jgi:ribosome-binding factor A
MTGEIKRAVRVAGLVQQELATLLRGLRDPRVDGVAVTRVEMTDDLSLARVYVRRELAGDDPKDRRSLLKGLEAASGKLRREVARGVALRYAPNLRFYYDEGLEAANRVEEILREIEQERGD